MGKYVEFDVNEEDLLPEDDVVVRPDPEMVNQSLNVHEAAQMGIHSTQDAQRIADREYAAAMRGESNLYQTDADPGDEDDSNLTFEAVNPRDVPAEQNPTEGDVPKTSKK